MKRKTPGYRPIVKAVSRAEHDAEHRRLLRLRSQLRNVKADFDKAHTQGNVALKRGDLQAFSAAVKAEDSLLRKQRRLTGELVGIIKARKGR